jgi:hypothetical protein
MSKTPVTDSLKTGAVNGIADLLRLRAAKSCLDLWYDFDEAETKGMPVAVVRAWQVGRDLASHLTISKSPPKELESEQ